MNQDKKNIYISLCGGEEPIFSKPPLLGDDELLNLRKMELFSQQNQAGECLWWPPENKNDCLREMLSLSGVDNMGIEFLLVHSQITPLQRCHLGTKSFLHFLIETERLNLYAICEFERLSKWIAKQDETEYLVRIKHAKNKL